MIGRAQLSDVEEHHGEIDDTASHLTVGDEKKLRRLVGELETAVDEKNWEKCGSSLAKLKQILSHPAGGNKS